MNCHNVQFSSFSFSPIGLDQKIVNKYSKCAMKFGHKNFHTTDKETFKIDKKFSDNFSDLIYLGRNIGLKTIIDINVYYFKFKRCCLYAFSI